MKIFIKANKVAELFAGIYKSDQFTIDSAHKGFSNAIDTVRRMAGEPTKAQAESGNYPKKTVKWNGLTIKIENPAGSIRRGATWETRMLYDYGYISRTEAVDGDEVDVYLGPDLETAPMVYVVHQRKWGDWNAYDEDKCMLGFLSKESAREAYLKHYDDPRFLGPITAMPVSEFIEKVKATREKPAMIKSRVLFFKTHVSGYTKQDGTFVAPHEDKRTKKSELAKMPDYIDIDGVKRSTTNSNGQPIAQTEEGVRNFWKWFGDSEVVDRYGKPLVVYHGTNANFEEFDPAKSDGFWFTDDKEMLLEDSVGASGIGRIIEAYLRAENLMLDGPNSDVESIREDGFDGVENRYEYGKDFAVLDPNQIKSATGNSGEFDPASSNITKSILFLKAKRKGDTSTVDMFGDTHLETRTRKDGVVQGYRVGNASAKPKKLTKKDVAAEMARLDGIVKENGEIPSEMFRQLPPEVHGAFVEKYGLSRVGMVDKPAKKLVSGSDSAFDRMKDIESRYKGADQEGRKRLRSEVKEIVDGISHDEWNSTLDRLNAENMSTSVFFSMYKPQQSKSTMIVPPKDLPMKHKKESRSSEVKNNAAARSDERIAKKLVVSKELAFVKPPKLDLPTIDLDGDTWHIVNTGATREDGKVYAHLSSTTRGRQAKNGVQPVQMADFIDMPDTITEPRSELIAEHERLVNVLESPSHEDDKVEAKKQAKELAKYKQGEEKPIVFVKEKLPKNGESGNIASDDNNNGSVQMKGTIEKDRQGRFLALEEGTKKPINPDGSLGSSYSPPTYETEDAAKAALVAREERNAKYAAENTPEKKAAREAQRSEAKAKADAALNAAIENIKVPSGYSLSRGRFANKNDIFVSGPFDQALHERIKRAGGSWDSVDKGWNISVENANNSLVNAFKNAAKANEKTAAENQAKKLKEDEERDLKNFEKQKQFAEDEKRKEKAILSRVKVPHGKYNVGDIVNGKKIISLGQSWGEAQRMIQVTDDNSSAYGMQPGLDRYPMIADPNHKAGQYQYAYFE